MTTNEIELNRTMTNDLRKLKRVASKREIATYTRALKTNDLETAFTIVDKYDPDNAWNNQPYPKSARA